MCDVKNCNNDYTTMIEGGHWVCDEHSNKPKLVCKHCQVPVVSRTDLNAILGKEHASRCPRYRRTASELRSS